MGKDGKIVSIDLDGTLLEQAYPEFGTINDGAIDVIKEFKDNGYEIIIYTARPWMDYSEIKQHLDNSKVPYDSIVCGKVIARAYIDDRAIRYEGCWKQVRNKVLNK